MHGNNTKYQEQYRITYQTNIKIVIPIKYRYLLGITRRDNLHILKIVLGQYHPNNVLILGQFYLGVDVLGGYIEPNGGKMKNNLKYLYPTGIKIMCNPHFIYPSRIR